MSWNYRVMAVPHPTKGWEEVYLTMNDVWYDDAGNPRSYGKINQAPEYRRGEVAGGETIEEVKSDLHGMLFATTLSILCAGDRWPQEYKP